MTSWSGNFRTKRLVHADGLVPFQTPKELEYSVELVPAHQGVFLLCGLHHVQFARPTHRKQVQQTDYSLASYVGRRGPEGTSPHSAG